MAWGDLTAFLGRVSLVCLGRATMLLMELVVVAVALSITVKHVVLLSRLYCLS